MHWLILQIRDLPWWIPDVAALAIYWLPKIILWPFRRLLWVQILVEEQAQMLAVMALVGFYLVYTLSWILIPIAEVALFVVACGALGGLAWLCIAGVTFIIWLIRSPANSTTLQKRFTHAKGNEIERVALTWRAKFRVLRGGKDT
ncbi:hypothetical protein LLE49_23950 [Alicyclobacillus tolerans]|uniref:hypothetical protein n=1 Tax=Alicyclobacillus tolerans TaxID=90970 RepID=UPI001F47E58D|nr:hypothetical protein [Alicyclobacillus tolerans]MCF8567779.1 hypothetical protein [Alicyclobacillus tolerans]